MFSDYLIFQVLFKEIKNKVTLLNHYGSLYGGKTGKKNIEGSHNSMYK